VSQFQREIALALVGKDQFTPAAEKAGRGLDAFTAKITPAAVATRAAQAAALGLAAAVTAASAAITGSALRVAQLADHYQALGNRLGVNATRMSELAHIAQRTDVEIEQITGSMRKGADAVGEAVEGNVALAESFKELGLDAQNLRRLKIDEQFETMIAALGGLENATDRVRIATDLFGREGAAMIQIIAQGPDAMRKLTEESAALGATIDQDLAQKAEAFDQQFTKVKAAWQGVANEIARTVLPVLTTAGAAAEKMLGLIRELVKEEIPTPTDEGTGFAARTARDLNEAMGMAAETGASLAEILTQQNEALGRIHDTAREAMLAVANDVAAPVAVLDKLTNKELRGQLEELNKLTTPQKTSEMIDRMEKSQGRLNVLWSTGNVTLDAMLERIRNMASTSESLPTSWQLVQDSMARIDDMSTRLDENLTSTVVRFGETWGATLARSLLVGKKFIDSVKSLFKGLFDAIIAELARVAGAKIFVGVLKILGFSGGGVVPSSPGMTAMQHGGTLPGYGGGDRVPTLLEPGEGILTKETVRRLGRGAVEAMNSGGRGDVGREPVIIENHFHLQNPIWTRGQLLDTFRELGAGLREVGAI
jgi:hypothetical protein